MAQPSTDLDGLSPNAAHYARRGYARTRFSVRTAYCSLIRDVLADRPLSRNAIVAKLRDRLIESTVDAMLQGMLDEGVIAPQKGVEKKRDVVAYCLVS